MELNSEKENEDVISWLESFEREVRIKKGIILTGNIQDEYFEKKSDKYLTLKPFLANQLLNAGYKWIGFWENNKGLTHPSKEQEHIFQMMLSSNSLDNKKNEQTEEIVNEELYEIGDADAEKNLVDSNQVSETYPELTKLLPIFLQLRKKFPIILIIDWSDFLVSNPRTLVQKEQELFQNFCSTLLANPFSEKRKADYSKPESCLIILSRQLGTIPPILYQNNPRVKIINLPLPDRKERYNFIKIYYNFINFERAPTQSTAIRAQKQDFWDLFADQTDDLRIVDLEQILLLSQQTEENLPLEKLINLYKFGKKKSPWEDLSEDRLENIEEILHQRVIGQEEAVKRIATTIIRAYMGLSGLQHSQTRSKPKGVLFFAGPTGVGKTELAKATAEFLFRDENACIRFDMSEYMHEHSDQRLIGAPPGYVGFEDGGQLTNAVKERPFCVLLFDEIEKAHARILDIFLQVLEDGRLTDGRGETVLFSETLIIFTSNLGASQTLGITDSVERKKKFLETIRNHFFMEIKRPELLNRIGDNIVIFNQIDDEEFKLRIIENKVQTLIKDLQNRYGIVLELPTEVLQFLRNNSDATYGGRGLINVIERFLLDSLAWYLFQHRQQLREGQTIRSHIRDGQIIYTIRE